MPVVGAGTSPRRSCPGGPCTWGWTSVICRSSLITGEGRGRRVTGYSCCRRNRPLRRSHQWSLASTRKTMTPRLMAAATKPRRRSGGVGATPGRRLDSRKEAPTMPCHANDQQNSQDGERCAQPALHLESRNRHGEYRYGTPPQLQRHPRHESAPCQVPDDMIQIAPV